MDKRIEKLKKARKQLVRILENGTPGDLEEIKKLLQKPTEPNIYVGMVSKSEAKQLNKSLDEIKEYLDKSLDRENVQKETLKEAETARKEVEEVKAKINKVVLEINRSEDAIVKSIEDNKITNEGIRVNNLSEIKSIKLPKKQLRKLMPKDSEIPRNVTMELEGELWKTVSINYPSGAVRIEIERTRNDTIKELIFSKK